ncbi:unnamed protein product [Caenorhabditis angaria]|uniref:Uncharacterized protein n=1 Tax=Caenorhabditis angaria TaxID=860376 RepID=A0A9P1IKY6_9PELO|nr:unnamed protein product [Caenorhabditis angaria]
MKLELSLVTYNKYIKEQEHDERRKKQSNMLENVSFEYNKSYPAIKKSSRNESGEPAHKVSKIETKTPAAVPVPVSPPQQIQQELVIEEQEPEQPELRVESEEAPQTEKESESEKRRQSSRKKTPKIFDDYVA